MTDQRLRELDRLMKRDGSAVVGAALLATRFRAGLVLPGYTSVREEKCPELEADPLRHTPLAESDMISLLCPSCDGTGNIFYDSWSVISLRSYVGDKAARQLAPDASLCEAVTGGNALRGTADWLAGLQHHTTPLPPARADVTCSECEGEGKLPTVHQGHQMSYRHCPSCKGEGSVTHDTPAQRYLMVVAACAVARKVFESGFRDDNWISDSIEACDTWIKCPCPAHTEACFAFYLARVSLPEWAFEPCGMVSSYLSFDIPMTRACQSAHRFSSDKIKQIASNAVLEALGE